MSTSRTTLLQGVTHLVVPVVMITHGVHSGSAGPLYYPPEELERSVPLWNAKPIVIRHPQSRPYSVTTPDIINSQMIGRVFGVEFDGERLIGEAYIDLARTEQLDYGLAQRLKMGETLEVSTGLFTENYRSQGTFNGKKFTHVARNHMPDHLAVLPDAVGACSIEAGCGLMRNSEER